MVRFILAAVISLTISCLAQPAKQDTVWQNFRFLAGNWTGQGGGEAGRGNYERSYDFIFSNKFIEVKNKTVYQPASDNPAGEVHEDLGYFSYDKIRKTFVLRQFHIEGFVNQYVLESMAPGGKKIVFTSEAIENIKPGWRAKETYEVINEDEFTETFELAPPGGNFEVYSSVTLKRKN